MYVAGCGNHQKNKDSTVQMPFLPKAQVLKLNKWQDVQNCPDTNIKRKEFSQVLKPKIMETCKSKPTQSPKKPMSVNADRAQRKYFHYNWKQYFLGKQLQL